MSFFFAPLRNIKIKNEIGWYSFLDKAIYVLCIEMHAWLSRLDNVENPDLAVMDLDPSEEASFGDVLDIALLCRSALVEYGLVPFAKTSGATGLHIFVPIKNEYPFSIVTRAMQHIAGLVAGVYPQKATVERTVAKRGVKVYLDYLQNARGRTMAFQYSLRPLPGAPVSAPLLWEEIESREVFPGTFDIQSIFRRIEKYGDLLKGMEDQRRSITGLLSAAGCESGPKPAVVCRENTRLINA